MWVFQVMRIAAIDEVFGEWVLPKMFARAASGNVTLEDALDQGHVEAKQIYNTWSAKGKI